MVFLVSSVPTVNCCEVAYLVSHLLWNLVNWWKGWQPPRTKQNKTKQKNVRFLALVLLVLYVELVFKMS